MAEGTRLLSEYGDQTPSRVRIPPSPLRSKSEPFVASQSQKLDDPAADGLSEVRTRDGDRGSRCAQKARAAGLRWRLLLFVSMKEGGVVKCGWGVSQGPLWFGGGERRSSLYGLLGGRTRRNGRPAPGAQFQKGRQAARRKVAPPGAGVGAKGWLRVSMCQIASVSLLAISIRATLAPRCLPRRCLLRW